MEEASSEAKSTRRRPLEDMRLFPSAESSGNIYRGEFFVKKIVRNFYETVPEKIA